LLHERDQGAFGGRICEVRREKAVDFVEDDERAERLNSNRSVRECLFATSAGSPVLARLVPPAGDLHSI
jgi:hypothetical protein